MNPSAIVRFVNNWDDVAKIAHDVAKSKGWHDTERSDGEFLMLIVSELSEALEGLRHGNPQSDHIPEYLSTEEELADAVIRIMDFSVERGWRIGQAIISKIEYNKTREYMHGGKRF